MSETKNNSTETSEKEPAEIIYVEYDINGDTKNENILLQVSEENSSGPQPRANKIKGGNSTESNGETLDEIDSPDLINIDDFKSREGFVNSPGNEGNQSTAVLCETTLESDSTGGVNDVQNVGEAQLLQLDQNIIEDIPNEVLVYTCSPEDDTVLNNYLCKICGIVVGCIFCLKSHYESIHLNLGIIQYKCDQTSYLKNYTEICHKCNLVCESKEEMFEHRKIHFVSCDVCDMSFDSALFLSNHCKTTHEKFEVIISCDLCEQWFKQLQDLSDHYESYHEMILCIVCFKRFATTSEMKQHHSTHKIVLENTESVLPYACSKCNQAFAEISDLSSHLTKDHPKKKTTERRKFIVLPGKVKKKRGKKNLSFNDCGGLTQDDFGDTDETDSGTSKKLKTDDYLYY